MRALPIFLCALLLGMLLAGCGETVETSEQMLRLIQEQEKITSDLQEIGRVEGENSLLVIAAQRIAAAEDVFNPGYFHYAGEFRREGNGEYSFLKMVPLYEYGWQNLGCKWEDGYVFVCNNENAVRFCASVTPVGGEEVETVIEIEETPWVYYYQLPEAPEGYHAVFQFTDAAGEEIR